MTETITPLYEAKIPRTDTPEHGYTTAEQELANALEGTAPRLAHDVAELLGPYRTVELARVVRRAVAVGIRRRAEQELAERLTGLYDVLASGLDQVTDGCATPEDEQAAIRG